MEMWKNFPLPPCGIALVKKNLCPSWEKRGGSFCGQGKTCVCRVTCNDPAGLLSASGYWPVQAQPLALNAGFTTYLPVQPALTLILVFLKTKKGGRVTRVRHVPSQKDPKTSQTISDLCSHGQNWIKLQWWIYASDERILTETLLIFVIWFQSHISSH